MTAYSDILTYLKGHPGVKASEIVIVWESKFSLREIAQAIDDLRQKPWVTATDVQGTDFTLTIPVVFHPMRKRGEAGTWNWNVTRAQTAVPLPDHFASIYEADIAWRDQGNAGTCVGQATTELFDAHYQRMMRDSGSADIPTTADRQMEQHNIPVYFDTGRASYFDKYWRQSFSAAGIYEDARQIGNVTPATGAYVSDSIHALKTIGIGMDWQWQNLKCGNARYDFPYPGIDPESNEKYYDTAKLHRITGYARLATVEDVKQAIYQYGGVLGAVEVYENYLDCKMDGHFPDPKGSSVGGHALWFYGWSGDNLLFRHSWRDAGFPKSGSLSSKYFERAAIDFYVPIDDVEVQIARQIYASMTAVGMGLPDDAKVTLIINSGTPVVGRAAGVKVALVDGAKYHLRLTDDATGRTVDLDYVVASVDKYIVFKFETSPGNPTNPPPAPKLSFKERLQAAIKAMLEKARCKRYGK